MKRSELHEIAVRRRGDPDVKALLLEIKRLHGVLVQAHELTGPIYHERPDLTARKTVLRRLTDLLESEPAIGDPSNSHSGKLQSVGPTENEGERAANRRARQERG